jgi:hypothetical protein
MHIVNNIQENKRKKTQSRLLKIIRR